MVSLLSLFLDTPLADATEKTGNTLGNMDS